jgi:hypothetical protein
MIAPNMNPIAAPAALASQIQKKKPHTLIVIGLSVSPQPTD